MNLVLLIMVFVLLITVSVLAVTKSTGEEDVKELKRFLTRQKEIGKKTI